MCVDGKFTEILSHLPNTAPDSVFVDFLTTWKFQLCENAFINGNRIAIFINFVSHKFIIISCLHGQSLSCSHELLAIRQ